MRKFIIHLILVVIMMETIMSLGCGINTWQYWVILLGCVFIYANADSD